MGDAVKNAGGSLSTVATLGAYNTKGRGWAQGGSAKDIIGDTMFGGYGSEIMDKMNPDVAVPASMQKPTFDMGSNGTLRSDLQLGSSMPASFGQSQAVLDRLQSDAMGVGPSRSAQYLQQANERNTQNALGNADALGATNMATARNAMAMRGGLDNGARERLQRTGGQDTMMAKQKVLNDGNGQNLEILAADEKQKQATMQALPAQLLAQTGMGQSNKQFDISNTLQTFGNKYNQDMAIYGGNQTAREQAQLANKNKGLLGLGMMGL